MGQLSSNFMELLEAPHSGYNGSVSNRASELFLDTYADPTDVAADFVARWLLPTLGFSDVDLVTPSSVVLSAAAWHDGCRARISVA